MTTQTAEKQAAPSAATSKGDVAVFQPPRLPWHPAIEERFGVDRGQWKALVEAVFPAAKSVDAVCLALSYCRARKLDPFKRVVHIVPVWDSEKRAYVETVWPGIAEHRTTAFRTKQYAGADAAVFGPVVKKAFTDSPKQGAPKETVELEFPAFCQVTVYRLIDGQRVPIQGPRVMWLETYSRRGRSILPNERWTKAPFQMIEKCAEAAALRRAFPEELGDEQTADEVESHHGADAAKDVTPTKPSRLDAPAIAPPADDAATAERSAAEAEAEMDRQAGAAINGRMPDTEEERGDVGEDADDDPRFVLVSAQGEMLSEHTAATFVGAIESALRDTPANERQSLWKANAKTVTHIAKEAGADLAKRLEAAQRFAYGKAAA